MFGARGWAGLLIMAFAPGCAGPTKPATAPTPVAERPRSEARSLSARQQLLAQLSQLESPDVLGQLPSELREALEARVAQLAPEERSALATAQWALHRPLLHLVAGGNDPDAWYGLATGGAAAELIETRLASGSQDLGGLIRPITDLTQAAAERWLFDRRLDVATPNGASPELCERIDRMAAVLGRRDLQLLARRTALAADPTPARRLDVARALASELDAEAAQAEVDRAHREAKKAPLDPAFERDLDEAQRLVEQARVALGSNGGNALPSAIDQARALLDLSRPEEARRVLESYRAAASEHLALATTLALADFDGTACPGLPATNPHVVACAVAWHENATVKRYAPILDRAWQSRQGRDDRAIEAYLGLRHVMPWLYSTMGQIDADPERMMSESKQRIARLRAAVEDAASDRQRFAGLAVFVDLLGAGIEAASSRKMGERVRLPTAEQDALVQEARDVAQRFPNEPYTQAAVLGAAAMLAQDRDAAEILAALPQRIDPRFRAARWSLDVWNSVAHARRDTAERARQTLMQLLAEDDPSLDRSTDVLTMAEADANLGGTTKDYGNLMQVADRLAQQPLPRELALRVAIDRAGVLQRQDEIAQAIDVLAKANAEDVSPGTTAEIDLGAIAHGYLVYLRGLEAQGDERVEYAEKLRQFAEELGGQVSVGVVLANALWLRELDYQVALARCEKVGCYRPALERQRAGSHQEVVKLVGPESANVVRRGVIPLGAVSASFTFSPREGLEPRVALDPILLAAPLPETK